jgi:hypothetical protein
MLPHIHTRENRNIYIYIYKESEDRDVEIAAMVNMKCLRVCLLLEAHITESSTITTDQVVAEKNISLCLVVKYVMDL